MAYKVNYGFQKAERDRAKAAKKEAKLRQKQAAARGEHVPDDQAEDGEPEPTIADAAPAEQQPS